MRPPLLQQPVHSLRAALGRRPYGGIARAVMITQYLPAPFQALVIGIAVPLAGFIDGQVVLRSAPLPTDRVAELDAVARNRRHRCVLASGVVTLSEWLAVGATTQRGPTGITRPLRPRVRLWVCVALCRCLQPLAQITGRIQ